MRCIRIMWTCWHLKEPPGARLGWLASPEPSHGRSWILHSHLQSWSSPPWRHWWWPRRCPMAALLREPKVNRRPCRAPQTVGRASWRRIRCSSCKDSPKDLRCTPDPQSMCPRGNKNINKESPRGLLERPLSAKHKSNIKHQAPLGPSHRKPIFVQLRRPRCKLLVHGGALEIVGDDGIVVTDLLSLESPKITLSKTRLGTHRRLAWLSGETLAVAWLCLG